MTLLRLTTAGVRLDVRGTDPAVMDLLTEVSRAYLVDARPASRERDDAATGGPDAVVDADAEQHETIGRTVAAVLARIDAVSRRLSPCLMVHAAALAGGRGALVVPGASGLGKSTLAGACLQAGFALLSDEAACFTPAGRLVPHPRPFGLSLHSRQLLGVADLEPRPEEVAIPPHVFGTTVAPEQTVRPLAIVVAQRRPGPACIEPAERHDGLSALLANCLNAASVPQAGQWTAAAAWALLGDVARSTPAVHLGFDDPHTAAAALAEHFLARDEADAVESQVGGPSSSATARARSATPR